MAKLRGGQRPVWAAAPVDVGLDQVHPVEGWVILEECFEDPWLTVGGDKLFVIRPDTYNTVFGKVLRVNQADQGQVAVGDTVVYSQWRGGRWVFRDQKVLILQKEYILAKVVDTSDEEEFWQ